MEESYKIIEQDSVVHISIACDEIVDIITTFLPSISIRV